MASVGQEEAGSYIYSYPISQGEREALEYVDRLQVCQRLGKIRATKLKLDKKEISNPGKIFAFWLPWLLRIAKYFMWIMFDLFRNGWGRSAPPYLRIIQSIPPLKWILRWGRAHSPWPIQYGLGCCMVDGAAAVASRWDLERFGMLPLFGPRQTDVLWISGSLTKKMAPSPALLLQVQKVVMQLLPLMVVEVYSAVTFTSDS